MTTSFTTNHSLPYPDGSEPPRGDLQMEALAEAVERELEALVPDTGTRIAGPTEITAGTGFEFLVKEYRAVGRRCTLHLSMKRTGAAVVGSGTPSSYNISGDPTIATIALGALRPVIRVEGTFRANLTSGSFSINPSNGVIQIYDLHYESSIAAPDSDGGYHAVQIYAHYPIADPIT